MSSTRNRTEEEKVVLITGGAGFIGAGLARALAESGRTVLVVDDESSGSFERLAGISNVRCVSLPFAPAIAAAIASGAASGMELELVVHLAAKVGVGPVVRDPESCRAHNVASTRELLDAIASLRASDRPRLFAASSSEVYLPASRPLHETDPLRPVDDRGRWAYAAAKVECERMIDASGLWEPARAPVHLRFFNVVGPGQDSAHGMMLPTFVEHALAHRPIPVHGEGRSVRTLAHVDDVAATLCALLQRHRSLPAGPLNIGGTARATVLEVAQCVLALSKSTAGIAHVDPRRVVGPAFEDVDWREPDLGRLASLGVPVPARTLEAIVADTLARHAALQPGEDRVRIARILTRLNLGGPARQALASDPLLVQRGHALRVFAGTPAVGEGDLFDEMRARGVDVERVPGLGRQLNIAGDLRALHSLRKGLAAFAPDVVHTHAAKAGAVGRRAARVVPRAARVHTFHGHVLEGYFVGAISKSFIAIERHLSKETDRIVAVSHATAEDLVRLKVVEDETKLVVVPPGIDVEPLLSIRERDGALRKLIGAQEQDFVAGVIGRLAEVKRPDWAIEVFTLLARAHPRLHLVFVGDGTERGRVERLILSLPADIQPRAHLVGARPDVRPVLADLDLVLLTSRSEGLPVALIEAAAAGKPVVATNVGGVSEIVAHERTGWLGASVDELAFGVAQYLEAAPMALQALGVRARLRASTRHSADALATRLEELYQATVEERSCAS